MKKRAVGAILASLLVPLFVVVTAFGAAFSFRAVGDAGGWASVGNLVGAVVFTIEFLVLLSFHVFAYWEGLKS